jgi:CHASE2 domain-containing sensor protein
MSIAWKEWVSKNSFLATATPVIISTLAVTGVIVGLRQLGWLQSLELMAYDRMMQLRPEPEPDSRLLTVLVTEEDIQAQGRWPLPDATLAKALAILHNAQPRAIGIDLYRDLPVEPGHAQLSQLFRSSDRLIAVCKLASGTQPSVGPPPSLAIEQVGFADIPVDTDGVVRRNLFYTDSQHSKCPIPYSFSLQLALRYLLTEGIEPQVTEDGLLQLGNAILEPINSNTGAYQNIDASGYQIILNYRAAENVAPVVTLGQVLGGQVNPDLIKGRLILLGVAAPSLKDDFYTPFRNQNRTVRLMPGVTVHAQMVSQLLSAALDGQPLIWSWTQGQEILWILVWALAGSTTAALIHRPSILVVAQVTSLIVLIGISWVIFLNLGWIPLVPPILALVTGASFVITFNAYQSKQEQLTIQKKVQEQEKSLVLMRSMLESLLNQGQQQSAPPPINTSLQDKKGAVLVGRYQVTRILGKGSFGCTYLAKDLQRPGQPNCVVKRLKPASDNYNFLQVARRLFKTEAEILEQVGKHDRIPLLLAYVEQDNEFYLIQEYIRGETLTEELIRQKQYGERQVAEILKEILSVLAFIQQYNLIHRDIKPDNIIRRACDRRLVLIDFGAVKQIQPQNLGGEDSSTVIIGTQGYAPPEQLAGQPVMASDIYATGMIAIQALTGMRPKQFQKNSETGQIVWQPYAQVSQAMTEIIEKMISYHFGHRYQKAAEVLRDIRRYETSPSKLAL